MQRFLGLVLVLLVSVSPAFAADAAPPLDLKGVRILICDNYPDLLSLPVVQRLEAAGAQVRRGDLATITWETVQPYNMIIALALSPPNPEVGQAGAAVLDRFVKAGGGLIFFCDQRGYGKTRDESDDYLAPFGGSIPWEIVQDPIHNYQTTGLHIFTYAYTDQVTPGHPVTEGVKAIWYPSDKKREFHTSPVKVSSDWQVLVTGEKEASSTWVGGFDGELEKPGIYPSAPPLIAAREAGAGRIVLFGMSPVEMFLGRDLAVYRNAALEKGDGARPSDLGRLFDNALQWLAASAVKSTELGQGELKAPEKQWWEIVALPDWSKGFMGNSINPVPDMEAMYQGALCANPARGVIGLHSTLSDGKATPEAMIAKAKELGLKWIGFTERLEDFSPEKWEQLRKICKAASTPEFAAMPGLDYADQTGTRFVGVGDFDWLPDKVFSKDKKRLIEPLWWFSAGNPLNGPYDLAHGPLRYWDLSQYDAISVNTTAYGQDLGESPKLYRFAQGLMDDPFPLAVSMVADEDQLTKAAGGMCNYVMQENPGDLTKYYKDRMYLCSSDAFVSDGPLVTDWRVMNATRRTAGQWWVPGTEQYSIQLSAHSKSPIKEVSIYDGPILFRRFCPDKPDVTLTLDLPHDQERNFTAEIVDADGKRAITGGLFVHDWLNFHMMCADRGNTLDGAVICDKLGPYSTGPMAPYQAKMVGYNSVYGAYSARSFDVSPPDFDGGMRTMACRPQAIVQSPDFTVPPLPESKMEIPVCSRDGALQDESIVGSFPGPCDPWHPKYAPKDIEGVHTRDRDLAVTPFAQEIGVTLVEGTASFDRPMRIDSLLVARVPASGAGYADLYAISTPENRVTGQASATPFTASGRMVPGSYAGFFPSLWGSIAVMALDDGYKVQVDSTAPNNTLSVWMTEMPRTAKAGETISYRYLVLTGRAHELPNTADWESFGRTMGLEGKPAYEVRDIKQGAVKGTKFLLELTPTENGFVGLVTQANLPIRLPIRVADMNPNWTFAWFDLDRKQWFPSAVDPLIRQGYFTLDTREGDHRIFAGHPVTTDDPNVRISVLSDGKSEVSATVNNVGDKLEKLTVRLNPGLSAAPAQTIQLGAGEMKNITFPIKTE